MLETIWGFVHANWVWLVLGILVLEFLWTMWEIRRAPYRPDWD